jgi:hypothetical protein
MAEAGEVVVHPDEVELQQMSVVDLVAALKENRLRIGDAKLQLAHKEAETRRAVEEHHLQRELMVVEQMQMRKIEEHGATRANRMPISEESLAAVIALKDQIKLENKRKQELLHDAELLERDANTVEDSVENAEQLLLAAEDNTGFKGGQGRLYENPVNMHRMHQKALMELETEQQTIKGITTKLTAQIEELSTELDSMKDADLQVAEAKAQLGGLEKERRDKSDDLAALKRISVKKDNMLRDLDTRDDHKKLRELEGNKKVLHSELMKSSEAVRVNHKAILANDERLRRLEAKLESVNEFLRVVFQPLEEGEESDSAEHRPDGFADGDTTVPVEIFDELCGALADQRATLESRNDDMEKLDANIENYDRKVTIVHVAQEAREKMAAQEYTELERERLRLEEHVNQIEHEFEAEQSRLEVERERLEGLVKK